MECKGKALKQLSYISSPNLGSYVYTDVVSIFKQKVEEHPDNEALIYRRLDGSRRSITYKKLHDDATKLASFLIAKGIRSGDRVAICGQNTLEWPVAEFAIFMAGGVLVTIGYDVKDNTTALDILKETECKVLFLDTWGRQDFITNLANLITTFKEHLLRSKNNICSTATVILLRENGQFSFPTLQSILQMTFPDVEFPTIYPEDSLFILSSSGTTGRCKLIEHTHVGIAHLMFKKGGTNSTFYSNKFFGSGGGTPESPVCLGQTRVFSDRFDSMNEENIAKIWNIIKSENCTSANVLPQFLNDLLIYLDRSNETFKLPALLTGGSPVFGGYQKVVGVYCDTLTIGYGTTETGSICSRLVDTHNDEEELDVGKPVGDKEVKIIDGNGNTTYIGEPGEVCARSGLIFRGYINRGNTVKSFTTDKWYKTGDIGFITQNGSLVIKGRMKEIIQRGPDCILPTDIEQTVMRMESITSVVVVAIPDKRLQNICVCFTPKFGYDVNATDVQEFYDREYFKGRIDLDWSSPKYFLSFDEFPTLHSGKFDKIRIRQMAIERLCECKN